MHPILERRGRLKLYLLAWVPLGLLLLGLLKAVSELGWGEAALLALPLALVYAFVCLAAAYPCRSIPISAASLARIVAWQAVAAALSATLWMFMAATWLALLELVPDLAGVSERFGVAVWAFLAAGVLLYVLAAALHYLLIAFEHAREQERRQLELQVLARDAELRALRAQLDPHFLFNSLNSISALVGSEPAAAREMCALLADLLRESLRLGRETAIPLREELALVQRYLAIEKRRFGERLRVSLLIDRAAEGAAVPPFLLQPLVENAVRHGVAQLLEGGEISIQVRRGGGQLLVEIANPVDPEARAPRGTGLGLESVRARLEALPGGPGRLEASGGPGRFTVLLELPVAAPEAPAPQSDPGGEHRLAGLRPASEPRR